MNKKHWSLVLAFVLVTVMLLGCGGNPATDSKNALIGKYEAVKMSVGGIELSVEDLAEGGEKMILEVLEDGTVTMDGEGGAVWKADGDKLVITSAEELEESVAMEGTFAKGEEDFYNLTITDEDMGEMSIIFIKAE